MDGGTYLCFFFRLSGQNNPGVPNWMERDRTWENFFCYLWKGKLSKWQYLIVIPQHCVRVGLDMKWRWSKMSRTMAASPSHQLPHPQPQADALTDRSLKVTSAPFPERRFSKCGPGTTCVRPNPWGRSQSLYFNKVLRKLSAVDVWG